MIDIILVIRDKLLLDHFWRIPFIGIDLTWKYDFPTKRLVSYCFSNYMEKHSCIDSKISQVAHTYSFDSTVSADKLDFIHLIHGTCTRERVRQILCKFIRENYK